MEVLSVTEHADALTIDLLIAGKKRSVTLQGYQRPIDKPTMSAQAFARQLLKQPLALADVTRQLAKGD